MPSLTLEERKAKIDFLIDNRLFEDEKLVYTFVLYLYSNQEIDECIDFVKSLLTSGCENHSSYYKLWLISLSFLRGSYREAQRAFFSSTFADVDERILRFYLNKLGFGEQYRNFIIEETEHFIFHIHPNRYENQSDIRHKIERRELGVELVAKYFFGITLERKIHYFLWDDKEMKQVFPYSHTCSCYGVIQEGEYNRDWHESTHVYNYLYGMETPTAFILEGIAVCEDGRKGSVRIKYANAAYKQTGICPSICEWWKDPVKFRNANQWIAYTTAGYFITKLLITYGKEKLLELAKYQSYEDACRIYGEENLLNLISETENDIIHAERLST